MSRSPAGSRWSMLAYCLFVCACLLLGCLFNRSLRAETQLGPNGTRREQKAQARLKGLCRPNMPKHPDKHAGQLVIWKYKEKPIWKYEMKEKKTTATPNKSSWTILMSALSRELTGFFNPNSNLNRHWDYGLYAVTARLKFRYYTLML